MPAAVIVPAVAAVGGSLLSYAAQSQAKDAQTDASNKALKAQQDAAAATLALQKAQYEQTRSDLSTYRDAGEKATTATSTLLGTNGADQQAAALAQMQNDPTYRALINQGTESVLRGASATGSLRAGGTASAIGANSASILNNLITQRISQLSNQSSLGESAAAQTSAAGQNYANQSSNAYSNLGTAEANAATQQGQIASVNPLLNSLSYGLGQVTQSKGLNDWLATLK